MLSSSFLHAGLLHLGLNSAALLQLGPEAEAVLGYGTFGGVYLLSGLAGASASLLFNDLTTVGASASIFGLLGAHPHFRGCGSLVGGEKGWLY
jgi:rhomboid protease GluP